MKRTLGLFAAALLATGITSYFLAMPFELKRFLEPHANLYVSRSIVTGQRDETRIPGFGRALVDAVRKVVGDPNISEGDVHAALSGIVADYVKGYTEHDRMADIPIHDEQGPRDRPFDLTVEFHQEKIDALLKKLGKTAWTGYRPHTLVFLAVNTDVMSYILTSDQDKGIDQRDSLASAAWQAGIPLVLPRDEMLKAVKLEPANLSSASQQTLEKLKYDSDADVVIMGSITWKSGMAGWQAEWSFTNA
ncbi:MAG: DUF2066 domain-containing protein, partial [Aestuariivirga sp.]